MSLKSYILPLFAAICLLLPVVPAQAQDNTNDKAQQPAELEPVPEPPPLPPEDAPGQTIEPTVTIEEEEDKRVESYSVNGKVYMIKVIPKTGKPYYLVDADGDGSMETRQKDLDPDFLVPSWVLFRW